MVRSLLKYILDIDPKRLLQRYTIAVALIFLMILISHISSVVAIHSTDNDAHYINVAGKQRMLSQRITYFATVFHLEGTQEARTSLIQAITEFENAHNSLVDVPTLTEVQKKIYFKTSDGQSMHGLVRQFIEDARTLVNGSDGAAAALQRIQSAGPTVLLEKLDRAVAEFENHAHSTASSLEQIEAIGFFGAVVLLTLEALLIFIPAHFSAKRYIERYERTVNGSSDGIWEWEVATNKVTYSRRFRNLLGYEVETEFPNVFESFKGALHTDDKKIALQAIDSHLRKNTVFDIICRLRLKDGRYHWFRVKGEATRDKNGSTVFLSGNMSDVTGLKETEAALRDAKAAIADSHEFQNLVFSAIPGYVFVKDDNFRIVQANDLFLGLYPTQTRESIIGTTTLEAFLEDERELILAEDRKAFADGYSDVEEIIQCPDGEIRTLRTRKIRFENSAGQAYILGLATDITEHKTLEARLEHQAWTDSLTGLSNRHALRTYLAEALENGRQKEQQLGLFLVDLDRFKPINDTYGHVAGDLVLKEIAARLQSEMDEADQAFRLGGDEFAVLTHVTDGDLDIDRIASRLLFSIKQPIEFDGRALSVGVSIGVAVFPDHDTDAAELMRKADTALYEAKASGRGSYRSYDELVDQKVKRLRRVEDELGSAIENGDLELHFQPKVCSQTLELVGAEALVRWNHPDHGMIMPIEFVQVAERCDLVFPLGTWVLKESWRYAERWASSLNKDRFSIAINVSSRQFFDSGFMGQLTSHALVDPKTTAHMELEVTEGILIDNTGEAVEILRNLERLGFKIAIDDFGTGYSSISYLHHLPVHKIKIDKSFLADFGNNEQAATIIRSIIDLGHNLGLRVIAEGVETEQQVTFLRENSCDEYQGYYFGKPMPAGDFEKHFIKGAPFQKTISSAG